MRHVKIILFTFSMQKPRGKPRGFFVCSQRHTMMIMSSDIALICGCGQVRGLARQVAPATGFRFVCYCTDCQSFARFLERQDVLDAVGGTDIFQMPAGRVTITAGADALRCISFSGKVLRWYADCCRTPVANTAATARFPIVALIHSFMDHEAAGRSRDELLGPPLCRIYERSATAPLPPNAPPPPSLGMFVRRTSKILGWWVRGLGRPNPFFDARTNTPLSPPRVLTPRERAALRLHYNGNSGGASSQAASPPPRSG